MSVQVTCLGGVGQVTGSCYLIDTGSVRFLVDCGLFQGGKKTETLNYGPWGFKPQEIPYLLLTHAHIDHSGRIPKLVKDGFHGKIFATRPTCELCRILFMDAAHIQEMHAEWQTRKNLRKGKPPIQPLYTAVDAEKAIEFLEPVERDREINFPEGIRVVFRNAGHILGSSFLELKIRGASASDDEVKMVFTGDLGRPGQLIVKDPAYALKADALFIESTYGDRDHKGLGESKEELLEAIRYSYNHGEKVLIPAFAVERTQEVLYILSEFFRNKLIPDDIPVYLDSPLAIEATKIFRSMREFYDEEALEILRSGYDPLDFPQLIFSQSVDDSKAINMREGSAIVIAGNGMCTAGRILHHIKHNIWRPGCSMVFVGYQAEGSIGRRIIEGAQRIRLMGEELSVRARVFTIGGLSSHAGKSDLIDWISHFRTPDMKVFVVHGEKRSSQAFAATLRQLFNFPVVVPQLGDSFIIEPRAIKLPPEKRLDDYVYELARKFLEVHHYTYESMSGLGRAEKSLVVKKLDTIDRELEEVLNILQKR
ncbi:MAG TPA: MBL fold metallo-hydrolase [Thermodesulforhabdus norvegica]|uniref:MBL fold metallo-hydrolase n=1 Tax=Thermodesulforhabdus norvegica TaxID=39841 RepID=A0A7C0WUU5_9BACT|nr:MBL fold metallo-hydrolase [Thermodesulforhabdus norvegica]